MERAPGLVPRHLAQMLFAFVSWLVSKVNDRQLDCLGRRNDLNGTAINFRERCSKDFVTPDDFVKAPLQ